MRDYSKYNRIHIIITAVILVIVIAVMLLARTNAEIDDETLIVKGTFFIEKIAVSDIGSIELLDKWDAGKRSFGMETLNIRTGVFTVGDLGQYNLCAYKNMNKFIKITDSDGSVTVFNLKTAEVTQDIYNRLKEKTTGA